MVPLTTKRVWTPRWTVWRTFLMVEDFISAAAPARLSTLRTSCTEEDETANKAPPTRNKIICSDFGVGAFALGARRISANSCGNGASDGDHALFYGGINVVEGESFVHGARFDGFARHTENYARLFVLSDDQTAGALAGEAAGGAVVAHASEDGGDGHGASVRCCAFHGDVDVGQIAVDAAGGGVELQASRGRDAHVVSAGANVECAGRERFVGLGFFHADAGEFSELRRIL